MASIDGRPSLGEVARRPVTVEPRMTAVLFDREVHPVYGTAWMVRHAEEAGRELVERHLSEDEDAVGEEIWIRHERAAPVGERLEVVATVVEVDGRRLVVSIEVRSPDRGDVVGRGRFVQRYVARGRLTGGAT
jgi:fluoroacetyl-CoA thioesterase